MNMIKSIKVRRDTKKVFFKLGTCSRTFFYIINREFGFPLEDEEHAADPLAGGILQQGYQCGMLWGASMAVGAESYRRYGNSGQGIAAAIKATRHIMGSFIKKTKSADCLDITSCDWSNKLNIARFFFSGKFLSCFKLADKWAPDAVQSAIEGLSADQTDASRQSISCASEVVRKMGGSGKEMVIVAGFAGGLGLSGNACGALAAAIWMNTLFRVRAQIYKTSFSDPETDKILKKFYAETDYKMECSKISGCCFKSVAEHTDFIKAGGCRKLIDILAQSGL